MSDRQTLANEPTEHLHDRREWPRDPYKGLNSFSAADAPLFGQRQTEVDDMVALLCSFDTRAVLLHGGTGTGKSSFLRAGLCQRLGQLPVEDGREFFFLSGISSSELNDPLLIRATDDPVGGIYDVLRKVGKTDCSTLSEQVRQTLCETLAQDIPRDRQEAIPAILDALRAITAPPQRATFVLLVDQAEEVLTLPQTADAENRRQAFFALIEQICFCREMDLRIIISLRTEYYGRFCSFFRIRPTTTLTPKTEVGAGLFDYLLLPLSIPDIAAAIRQPTLNGPRDDGLPSARSVYKFSYQERLPETISADLDKQSGEASTLPSMQIVCKQLYERVVLREKRAEITEQDYARFGRAQGAIDAFMVRAIRDAATAASLQSPRDRDVDKWALVLDQVVGRAEGGTVQTLIASRQDLITEAGKQGIARDAAEAMLNKMADPERRLLRAAGGEGGALAYSLGHDSLGPSVLRRAAQAAVRAEEEKKQAEAILVERSANERVLAKQREDQRVRNVRSRIALVTISVISFALTVVAAAALLASHVWPLQQKIEDLSNYAMKDQSADFRLKLLLAASALRLSDTRLGHWFVDEHVPKTAVREVLLRSPIYGGIFDAGAWDVNGKHVVRLQNNKVVIRDLGTGKESQSDLPEDEAGLPTSVGLTQFDGGTTTVGAFRIPAAKTILGQAGSNLISSSAEMPKALDTSKGIFISRADIFGTHFRVIFMNFVASAINKMWVVPLAGNPISVVKLREPADEKDDLDLDWKPVQRNALRQPVLAEDCDLYAFLGRNLAEEGKEKRQADYFKVWIGHLAKPHAQSLPIQGYLTLGSIAVERGCRSIVVRDDNSKLHIVPLDKGFKPSDPISVPLEGIPEEMRQILAPTFGQTQPMLAASRMNAGANWRVAWLTSEGMTLINIEEQNARLKATLVAQMLTGIEPNYALGSLSLSPNGLFGFLSTQQNFSAPAQLRAFDLNLDRRRKELEKVTDPKKLIEEACRVAKFQTGYNFLTATEREIWLGSSQEPQPCTGKE